MRESMGGTWLLQLMVIFILLFAGYIILTLNYSKTIKVKNEIVSIIEKYEGLNENSIELVNSYLLSSGYVTTGTCPAQAGVYGATDFSLNELEPVTDPKARYLYCVKKYKGAKVSYYYQATVFYKFNLPVLGDISYFQVKGTTGNFQAKDNAAYGQTVDGSYGGVSDPAVDGGAGGGAGPVSPSPVPTYTVSFDLDGGNGSVPSQSVKKGFAVTKPSNPTKDGFTFVGWQLNGSTYNFSASVNGNMTLKAKWTPTGGGTNVYYTVSFNLDGGTAQKKNGMGAPVKQISPQQVLAGKNATKPADPFKYTPAATFVGWELNGAPYDFSTPVTSNITLNAKWTNKVKVYINYGSCGYKSQNDDNPSDPYAAHGSVQTNGTVVLYLDYNSKLKTGAWVYKVGPDYDDNQYNNRYNWTYTLGYSKPITGWKLLDGTPFDVNTPLTSSEVHVSAVC